jgi:hypothetical protein
MIGSGQAFFIGADSNGTVQFNNSMRSTGFVNTQFFRTNSSTSSTPIKDRMWLNLTNSDGAFNQTLIGFFENATDGFDRRYDGEYFNTATYLSLYSMMNETPYTILGKPTFNLDNSFDLGFEANLMGTLTLSIDVLEGVLSDVNTPIFLIDYETETVHDLKESDYEFTIAQTGTYNNRFKIVFQEPQSILAVDDVEINSNQLIISNESENILIQYLPHNTTKMTQLKVYDILGRILVDKKIDENTTSILSNSFADGALLIFKVQLDNGEILSKKFIKL